MNMSKSSKTEEYYMAHPNLSSIMGDIKTKGKLEIDGRRRIYTQNDGDPSNYA
jgi:hypothetical protein